MSFIIRNLSELDNRYSIIFCDVWGCIHNGINAFQKASSALASFRQKGGIVVLLTNAPRPADSVMRQLTRIGVDENSYDHIVTAGDAALEFVKNNFREAKIYHLGPKKDESFFNALRSSKENASFHLSSLEEASLIICTGLFDDSTETPDDYEEIFLKSLNANLPMVCTNPDIFVDFGNKRIFCAGALASRYMNLGGKVYSFGKPYEEIYNFARNILHKNEIDFRNSDLLCIGDGLHTDIKGANNQKIHSLFIADGLERASLMKKNNMVNELEIQKFFQGKDEKPNYVMGQLK